MKVDRMFLYVAWLTLCVLPMAMSLGYYVKKANNALQMYYSCIDEKNEYLPEDVCKQCCLIEDRFDSSQRNGKLIISRVDSINVMWHHFNSVSVTLFFLFLTPTLICFIGIYGSSRFYLLTGAISAVLVYSTIFFIILFSIITFKDS